MTRTPDCTLSDRLVELIADEGFDALPELMRIMINAAMQAERQQHLQAAPYERTEERRGDANGFKPKTMTTPDREGDVCGAAGA
jgi:putative transposase